MDAQIIEQKNMSPLVYPGIIRNGDQQEQETDHSFMKNFMYPELKKIGHIVASHHNKPFWQLKIKRNFRKITVPRHIAMYFSKRHTRYSLYDIGEYFGGFDHATVLHAVKTVKNLYDTDREYRDKIDYLDESIRSKLKLRDDGPIYIIDVNHDTLTVYIHTNVHFDYAAFLELTTDLAGKGIDNDYKVVML